MKCPSCGAPGMKRTFNATHDPERFYLCKECGHTLSRIKEPWSGKDQRFFIMARLDEQNRLLEEIRDALKERPRWGRLAPVCPRKKRLLTILRAKLPVDRMELLHGLLFCFIVCGH